MNLDSMRDILNAMEAEGREFWEVVLETDMENRQVTREQSMEKMSAVCWTPRTPTPGSGGA